LPAPHFRQPSPPHTHQPNADIDAPWPPHLDALINGHGNVDAPGSNRQPNLVEGFDFNHPELFPETDDTPIGLPNASPTRIRATASAYIWMTGERNFLGRRKDPHHGGISGVLGRQNEGLFGVVEFQCYRLQLLGFKVPDVRDHRLRIAAKG